MELPNEFRGLPSKFRDLPTWAAILGVLVGGFAVMTALSMVLGILFASIAVAIELGSIVAGVLSFVIAISFIFVPLFVGLRMLSGDDQDESDEEKKKDQIALLRERYVAGEVGEGEFEQRLDRLLNKPAESTDETPDNRETSKEAE